MNKLQAEKFAYLIRSFRLLGTMMIHLGQPLRVYGYAHDVLSKNYHCKIVINYVRHHEWNKSDIYKVLYIRRLGDKIENVYTKTR